MVSDQIFSSPEDLIEARLSYLKKNPVVNLDDSAFCDQSRVNAHLDEVRKIKEGNPEEYERGFDFGFTQDEVFSNFGTEIKVNRWDYWLRKNLWTPEQATCLIYEIDPHKLPKNKPLGPGSRYFCRKIFSSIPAGKNRQKLRDRLCLRRPDSSASPRFDPTRGRNIGSRMT